MVFALKDTQLVHDPLVDERWTFRGQVVVNDRDMTDVDEPWLEVKPDEVFDHDWDGRHHAVRHNDETDKAVNYRPDLKSHNQAAVQPQKRKVQVKEPVEPDLPRHGGHGGSTSASTHGPVYSKELLATMDGKTLLELFDTDKSTQLDADEFASLMVARNGGKAIDIERCIDLERQAPDKRGLRGDVAAI
jgi:hypothetical protein